MAKQLPIIARTNKSGLDLLTVHKSQTLVLPDDNSAPDCDVALTLHSEAQEIIDSLYEALGDALSGLRYVRERYGSLSGVGFDRVDKKGQAALDKACREEV
ncbi:hypothetical protein [Brucella intermedia]|uniref:hypothetical protein n=1 Tax=Brucella intermedia TaxID=94625 RepID=UPI0004688B08|nr:hypothetical protein [Brucella intermedia]